MISAPLRTVGLLLLTLFVSAPAALAADGECKHAISLIGAPKMGADFKHFDWVNPDAPKGGTIRQFAEGTFDTLNPFSDKGVKAGGLGLVFDSLMASIPDEPATELRSHRRMRVVPGRFSSATFKLRPEARFHDGTPITPEDVIFSFEQMKTVSAMHAFYWKNVVKAEKTGDHEVTFTFDLKGNRELPMIIGELQIALEGVLDGKGANGEPRDMTETTVEPPLGNGAYKIKSFEIGRKIMLRTRRGLLGQGSARDEGPVQFRHARHYLLPRPHARLRGFQGRAGSISGSRQVASDWATKYDFEAMKKRSGQEGGHSRQARRADAGLRLQHPAQAVPGRARAPSLQSAVRFRGGQQEAFLRTLCPRRQLLRELRTARRTALPEGRELEILNEVKAEVPPEVFTTRVEEPGQQEAGRLPQESAGSHEAAQARPGWTLGHGSRAEESQSGEPFAKSNCCCDGLDVSSALRCIYRARLSNARNTS